MTRAISIDAPAPAAGEAATAPDRLSMTEPEFSNFYARTARPLKSYLARITGSQTLAEDLLQESYYRMLRASLNAPDESHRKNYLYRIATNLARDHFRQKRFQAAPLGEHASPVNFDARMEASNAVRKALGEIKPNERELAWLAYVEGASHREIAEITGLKEASVRPLLFRVRQKLARLLRPDTGGAK